MTTESEPDSWDDYDSGPYCSHWASPWDCDEMCTCGHQCKQHCEGCNAEGCACEAFADATESPAS